MTNKIFLPVISDECSFCQQKSKDVEILLVGCTGKAICNSCVGFVREEMGLVPQQKTPLEVIIDSA